MSLQPGVVDVVALSSEVSSLELYVRCLQMGLGEGPWRFMVELEWG